MIKLLIVEDESIIRQGLKQTVDWHGLGFQVVGEAENGVRGLELAREFLPQVVLTDIRMPVMDGLTMLKALKQEQPEVKVVLLSGHEEFEYAKEGMLLGAEGYILKLCIERDLPTVFNKIIRKLEDEDRTKSLVDGLKNECNELICDSFLRKAIIGEVSGEEIKTLLDKELDIPLIDGTFCSVCIQFENLKENTDKDSISIQKERLNEFLSQVDFSVYSCGDLVMLQPGYKFHIIYYAKDISPDELYRMVISKWKGFQREICHSTKEHKWRLSIGLGTAGTGWHSIYNSSYEARKAAMFKALKEMAAIFEWKDLKSLSSRNILSVREQNELVQSIVMGDGKFVKQQINYMFRSLDEGACFVNMQELQQYFLELLVLVKWKIRELEIELPESCENSVDISRLIMGINDLNELCSQVRDYLIDTTEKCYEIRKQPSRQNIMKVAAYLDSHFNEKILLEEMANYVYMSPSHFSVLFKQHIGKSFSDYLLDLRMNKARALLEENHAVNHVAERVGYQDIRHFSKTFKKYFGMNPSEVCRISDIE